MQTNQNERKEWGVQFCKKKIICHECDE